MIDTNKIFLICIFSKLKVNLSCFCLVSVSFFNIIGRLTLYCYRIFITICSYFTLFLCYFSQLLNLTLNCSRITILVIFRNLASALVFVSFNIFRILTRISYFLFRRLYLRVSCIFRILCYFCRQTSSLSFCASISLGIFKYQTIINRLPFAIFIFVMNIGFIFNSGYRSIT